MKFKLDECLDVRLAAHFYDAGHDIQTVYQEKLSGAPDERVYSACLHEKRTLVTQDMVFQILFVFLPCALRASLSLEIPPNSYQRLNISFGWSF